MDKRIIKIDLDLPTIEEAKDFITERLIYCNDLSFLDCDRVEKIEFLYKSTYGCRIVLKDDYPPEWIVIFQLILGSDYRKEVNTLINHFKLNMEYSNRLFTTKRYSDGTIKSAVKTDLTKEIKEHIKDTSRIEVKN